MPSPTQVLPLAQRALPRSEPPRIAVGVRAPRTYENAVRYKAISLLFQQQYLFDAQQLLLGAQLLLAPPALPRPPHAGVPAPVDPLRPGLRNLAGKVQRAGGAAQGPQGTVPAAAGRRRAASEAGEASSLGRTQQVLPLPLPPLPQGLRLRTRPQPPHPQQAQRRQQEAARPSSKSHPPRRERGQARPAHPHPTPSRLSRSQQDKAPPPRFRRRVPAGQTRVIVFIYFLDCYFLIPHPFSLQSPPCGGGLPLLGGFCGFCQHYQLRAEAKMSVNTPLGCLDYLCRLPLEIYVPPSPAPPSRGAVPPSAERGQSEAPWKREERLEEKRMILRERKVRQAVKIYLDEVDRETSKREIRRRKPRKNEQKGRHEGEATGRPDLAAAEGKNGGGQTESPVAKAENELHLEPTQTEEQPKTAPTIPKELLKMVYKCLAELKQTSSVAITSGMVRSRITAGALSDWQLQGCLNELDGRGKIHFDRDTQTIYL